MDAAGIVALVVLGDFALTQVIGRWLGRSRNPMRR